MITRSIVCLALLAWGVAPTFAQSKLLNPRSPSIDVLIPNQPVSTPPPPEIESKIKEFYGLIQGTKYKEAYALILKDSEMDAKEIKIDDLTAKTEALHREFGIMNGFELYDNRTFGSRICSVTYFTYHPKMPIRWRFVFYAGTNQSWRMVNMSFDDLVVETLMGK